jgi:hypothetical protein
MHPSILAYLQLLKQIQMGHGANPYGPSSLGSVCVAQYKNVHLANEKDVQLNTARLSPLFITLDLYLLIAYFISFVILCFFF